MLIPGDILTDLDLLALDSSALKAFGATSEALVEKRRIAISDWMKPRLEQANLPVDKHSVRRAPDQAFGYTGGTWTDLTARFSIASESPVSSILVSTADAIYLGMRDPFRGTYVGMTDNVNTNSLSLVTAYWNGQWNTLSQVNSFVDGTKLAGVSFARGGRLLWALPEDWFQRSLHGSDPFYWVRLSVSAAQLASATAVGQLLPLSRSRLTDPAAHYALHLVYREGMAARNDYEKKAKWFLDAAVTGLDTAITLVGDEFDVNNTQAVERVEQNSMTQTPWVWERG